MRVATRLAPLLATLLFPALALAATPMPAPVTDPQTFVAQAAPSNLFEVQSSELALQRTTTPTIVAFAKRMIRDHTKAARDLAPAARAERVAVPTTLDEASSEQMSQLGSLTGRAFDTAYVSMQVMAHDQAVMLFEGFATSGQPGRVKTFAAKTLPTLTMHQQMIHTIAGR